MKVLSTYFPAYREKSVYSTGVVEIPSNLIRYMLIYFDLRYMLIYFDL